MVKRPQDLLEFLRRTEAGPSGATLETTPRMLVLRRSQAVVAAAAAGLALLFAFLLGLGMGGGGTDDEDAALGNIGVWVIRVVSYEDNEKGRRYAKTVMSQLEKLRLGDEVNLRRIVSTEKLVVTVGSWLQHPKGGGADKLLDRVKSIQGRDSNERPFAAAGYWRITR